MWYVIYNVLRLLDTINLLFLGTATIIASMLVSPIMGPVIALGYVTTINDRHMVWMAFKNEMFSLLFCILIGVIIGACTGWVSQLDQILSYITSQYVS